MKKKILATLLALTMIAPIIGAETTEVYANDYTSGTSANCTVTCTVASTFSVSIPATLTLADGGTNGDVAASDDTYSAEYTVGAKGNISANEQITIAPSASTFTMTDVNNGSNTATANVTQSKTTWTNTGDSLDASNYKNTTGLVTCDITQAGAYSGTLTFNYGVSTV